MTCSAVYFLYPAPKKAQHFPENNSVFNKTALGKKEASLCHPHSKIQYGREGVSHCHQGYSLTYFIITFTYPDWEKLHNFDISYCLILVMSCQTITPTLCEHSFYCGPAQFTTDHCSCVSSSSLVMTCSLCCLCLF